MNSSSSPLALGEGMMALPLTTGPAPGFRQELVDYEGYEVLTAVFPPTARSLGMALGVARPAAMAPSRRRPTIIVVVRASAASAFAAPIVIVAGSAAIFTLTLARAPFAATLARAAFAAFILVATLGSMSVLPAAARRFRMTFGVAKPAALAMVRTLPAPARGF